MNKFKDYKKYLKSFGKNKLRLYIFVFLFLFFWTIPSRLIYSFGQIEAKPPIYQEIDIEIPTPYPYPVNTTQVSAPYLSARSIIAVDAESKAVIYMKNPDERLHPASTTKMITALVALDQYNLEDIATINEPYRVGQIMELYQDEKISIKALISGLMIHSGNDAAYALADFHPRGRGAFVNDMNVLVRELGLTDTNFSNPAGLDNGEHYSTVHDLALIGSEVISNSLLLELTSTKNLMVSDISGEFLHNLESTNQLLGVVPGLKGIKTGWTEYAGECLVSYIERDEHHVITALLGSYDRFGETKKLIDWIFANHKWEEIDLEEDE